VISTRQSGRLPTGAEISIEMHAAGEFRDGQVVEMRWFMNEVEARKAAGLPE
jgi:hypothetical protein